MRPVRPLTLLFALALAAASATIPATTPSAGAEPKILLAPTITALVSVTPSGGSGNDYGDPTSMSTDGRYVTWRDGSTNLVAGDTNGEWDVFVRDMVTDITERVDVSDTGVQANGAADSIPTISRNGRYVAFASLASNLVANDANGKEDVFVRDRVTDTTELVSVDSSEAQGNANSWVPAISGNGRYVAFMSTATNLVGSDSNGVADVFVRDLQLGTTERISVTSLEAQVNGASGGPTITNDGRYVVYQSDATNLVAGDTNGVSDVFRRDRTAGTTLRVSTAAGGVQATGGTSGSDRNPVSDDGNLVTFTSAATNLVAGDTNASTDVFQRNLSGGTIVRVNVGPGNVQATASAYRPGASSDGSIVTFASPAPNLVAGDTNGSNDVFTRNLGTGTTTRETVTTAGSQLAIGGGGASISPDGSAVTFGSESGDVVATPASAGTVFQRKRQPVAPFNTVAGFVAQQSTDFGAGRTAAQQQADVTKILSGFPSYQRYAADFARSTTWISRRAAVIRLYWAFFLRPPDTAGINYWIGKLQNGKKLDWVAQNLTKSSEFQAKYGSLNNLAFVTLVYQNVLSRNPDNGGLTHWVDKLDKGLSRGSMMTQFSESSEGKRILAPQTDVVLVSLGMLRAVPNQSDFDDWVSLIALGGSMEDVVTEILASPAYAARITP